MHRLYRRKEQEYWDHTGDPKRLWSTFSDLLGRARPGGRSTSPLFIKDTYIEAFNAKVHTVREDIVGSPLRSSHRLNMYLAVRSGSGLKSIPAYTYLSPSVKTCDLDPFLTFLL